MKLFLVIYSGLKIGGSVGPLPYGITECWVHANEMTEKTQTAIKSGLDKDGNPIPADKMEGIKGLRFACEWRQARPELGDPA